jgi:hypothetical protein
VERREVERWRGGEVERREVGKWQVRVEREGAIHTLATLVTSTRNAILSILFFCLTMNEHICSFILPSPSLLLVCCAESYRRGESINGRTE